MTAEPQDAPALFHALLDHLGRLDFEGLEALLHPDAVFEFPFRQENPTSVGREAILERLRSGMGQNFVRMDFTIRDVHLCQDPNLVIAEYESVGQLTSGREYRNRYVGLVRVRNGQVEIFREYFNPLAMARATG